MRETLLAAIDNRCALTRRLNARPAGPELRTLELLADIERDLALVADVSPRGAPDAGIAKQLNLIASAAAALSSAYGARVAKREKGLK